MLPNQGGEASTQEVMCGVGHQDWLSDAQFDLTFVYANVFILKFYYSKKHIMLNVSESYQVKTINATQILSKLTLI